MKKHLEIVTFTKHDINIQVEIDYDQGKISLVQNRKVKNWVFAGRGIEYMQEWRNVLEAMSYAISSAEDLLEDEQESDLLQNQADLIAGATRLAPKPPRKK